MHCEIQSLARHATPADALITLAGGDIGGEFGQFPKSNWIDEVDSKNINSGYWEWAAEQFMLTNELDVVTPTASTAMSVAIESLITKCGGNVHGNCSAYPRRDWRHEVRERFTKLGYWEWVIHQAESNEMEIDELA